MFKNEMQKTINEQNEKINRLEKAFRDVTGAYKTLLSEKEALQKSVKLLNESSVSTENKPSNSNNTDEQNANEHNEKISALSNNIQILLESKAKLESSFQVERKKLKNDFEELKMRFEENQKILEDFSNDNRELKLSLKQIQQDKEKLNQELKEAKRKLHEEEENVTKTVNLDQIQKEYKELVSVLRHDNDDLKQKLKSLNEKLNSPSEEVLKLEREMNSIKSIYEKRLSDETNSLMQVEIKLKENIEKNEKRTVALETEITELYKIIATYENKKTSEFNETRKDTLLSVTSQPILPVEEAQQQMQSDEIEKAIQKIYELKNIIETHGATMNLNLSEIWKQFSHKTAFDDEKMHEKCRDEYKMLKDEYERFKVKSNQMLKAKQNKDQFVSTEVNVQQFKDEIEFLRNRINQLEKTKSTEQERHDEKVKNLESLVQNMKKEHNRDVERTEQSYKTTVKELEEQLLKQRDRTIKLISEKDYEIERLKIYSHEYAQSSPSDASAAASGIDERDYKLFLNQPSKLDKEMSQLKLTIPGVAPMAETNLLLYSQELAFKEADLSKLRRIKSDLENRVKEILIENQIEIDNHRTQIDLLKREIERMKLNSTREQQSSANMEYIKNVVYRFLTTKDPNVRIGMIHAITQILQFTFQEKTKVLSFYSSNNSNNKK